MAAGFGTLNIMEIAMAATQKTQIPREQQLELIIGFALTGAVIGALTAYSWFWKIPEAVCAGLLGAAAGAVLGRSLLLSVMEMLITWLVSFVPIFLGYMLGAIHSVVMGLLAATGGLGLGYFLSTFFYKAPAVEEKPALYAPEPEASKTVPETSPGEKPPQHPQKIAPYRASRRKRK
jgi:hypothetical protein